MVSEMQKKNLQIENPSITKNYVILHVIQAIFRLLSLTSSRETAKQNIWVSTKAFLEQSKCL